MELMKAQLQLARSAKGPMLTGGFVQEELDRALEAVTATADTAEAATATADTAEAATATADTVAVLATVGTGGWTMLRQAKVQ